MKNSDSKKLEVGCQLSGVKCSRSGFTLMELVVAMSLFISVMALAAGVFVNTLRTQREIVALTTANGNISQAIEQMAREVRTGRQFQNSTSSELKFINYKNERIGYKLLADGTMGRCVDSLLLCSSSSTYNPITSDKVKIEKIQFAYMGETESDGLPPRITIVISVKGFKGATNYFQTTMSSKILGG